MNFKGDIIITDPCYIIKKSTPEDWDKCDFGDNMEVLGINHYISESTIYGDWSCTTYKVKDPEDAIENFYKSIDSLEKIKGLYGKLSKKYKEELERYNSIWQNKSSQLGEFCADAGMVGVFLLDEVLKYNPEFDWWLSKPWTTTLIRNFDGDVRYYLDDYDNAHIIGEGNINFVTIQTGL